MDSATTYDEYWTSGLHRTDQWGPDYFQEHLGLLAGRDRVLDYGCGLGFSYQRQLVSVVKDYYGADVSDVALEDLRQKRLGAVKIGPDGRIAQESDFFDAAVCSEVLEHLYDPLSAAREIFRVLKPGGIAIVTTPNFGYFAWRLRAFLAADVWSEAESAENPFKGVHIRYFSFRSMRRLGQMAGFTDISLHRFDRCKVWHVCHALGPLKVPFAYADQHFPTWTHMRFLDTWLPSVFSPRLRMVAHKPS